MAFVPHSFRRTASAIIVAALAAILVASTVFASTPVTVGFRDQTYGGGAARPSGDKPQSKLWFTDGSWFAGIFQFNGSPNPKSEYQIFRLNETTHAWVSTGTVVDTRDTSHADYLWHEGSQTLYVASVLPVPSAIPAVPTADGIRIYKYTYNATSNAYTPVGPIVTIPDTTTVATVSKGGAPTVTIARDSTGDLWAAWPRDNQIKYSTSGDSGATWSTPAQVPVQAPNPVRNGTNDQHDSTAVVAFGANVGIVWSDHDALPTGGDDGFYFASIAAGADPTVGANWTLQKLPTLVAGSAAESADNHVNIKATSDGSVYMVGKTGKDTLNCATQQSVPLIEFFERTPAGSWSAHLVGTVGDCNTRPQLVISEQLDTAYVFLTSPNGGGTVYRKSAPLNGPDAFDFRGAADTTIQRGTPFIKSATETLIDDASTTKQTVTSASGIVVLGNNLTKAGTPNVKYYLHNEMAISGVADVTDPVGTATINAGAVGTTVTTVSVAVPATDAGSGVSLVRLSNSATVSGGVLSGAGSTSFTYDTPISWILPAGDGTKTVYAQWRDSAGNWSTPVSDTIVLDANAPTGTVSINGGAATTDIAKVTLTLTANDGGGSGVTSVLISNSTDFSGVIAVPFATTINDWFLTSGDGVKTVYVKFIDAAGTTSAAFSDSITLDATDVTPPSAAGVPRHTLGGTETAGIPVRLVWTASPGDPGTPSSGVAGYQVQQSINGGAFATVANPTSNTVDVTLSNSSKTYRFRVATRDLAGNLSAYAFGTTFKATTYNESASSLKYTGTWNLSTGTYIGGKAKYATNTGASATFTFTGGKVGWLTRSGPGFGTAKVYVDGSLRATINLNTPTTIGRKLVYVRAWSTVGTHTLKVVVSSPGRVTIDQFLVLR